MSEDKYHTFLQLFEESVALFPNTVAVQYIDETITYAELDNKSSHLARLLLRKGVKSGDRVCILLERSINVIVAFLAVQKTGGVYIPIDPDYPTDRVEYMLQDSQAKIAICSSATIDRFYFKEEKINIEVAFQHQNESLEKIALPTVKAQDSIYIIYTSGSTGKPKGVEIKHSGLHNFIKSVQVSPGAKNGDVWACVASVSFDMSVLDIYLPLSVGATLLLTDPETSKDGELLLKQIKNRNVTIMQATPSTWRMMLDAGWDKTVSKIKILAGGEALTQNIVSRLIPYAKSIWNLYGPTETTVYSSIKEINFEENLITVGKPINNTTIFIVDENLRQLPDGSIGEILIGGDGVAKGYINRLELTKEKFIPNHFESKPHSFVYRTGDLGKILPNGELQCLGRIDHQVKIRGHRIELEEIENVLLKAPGVFQCVVSVKKSSDEDNNLIAYIVSKGLFDKEAITSHLKSKLPDFMVPPFIMEISTIPTNSSGKVDRKALPDPDASDIIGSVFKAPKTDVEKELSHLWQKLLGVKRVGVLDNFFELGGSSLLAQKVVAEVKRKGYNLPITKLYQLLTVEKIAAFIENRTEPLSIIETAKKKSRINAEERDIAIIGMAGKFPGASTIDELWEILLQGKETTSFFTPEQIDPSIPDTIKKSSNYIKARGVINGADLFDPIFFGISPKMASLMDPQQRILLEIAWEVLEKSGYTNNATNNTIGVYAGGSINTYHLYNVLAHPDLIQSVGSFPVTTVNDKDYLSSRISYSLNLKGPAVTVQSACSTSLLAVAQAVESIRQGYCDMAIAGGVAITTPINSGHLYEEGAMLSKDGHTNTFDSNSTGTIFSDGAAVVLLKEKRQAELDGDTIFAVIKGIGISNDGGNKGSFTAPSSAGQATAIKMAIDDANVDPSTISYVEAHGTGTPLGDPIEIEGLKMAFGEQEKKQYCRIGSIKTNMGHLTVAAGAAGLIKATLALYHKKIPASINYKQPNPNIDFINSPFLVNDSLYNWDSMSPRRAGISSFGVGGTNVHVVLEEAPVKEAPNTEPSKRPLQLLTYAAKSKESIELYSNALSEYTSVNGSLWLEDIAYTLNNRNSSFPFRKFIIADNTKNISSAVLNSQFTTKKLTEQVGEIVFMYPGQGAQYINMGKELYASEPVFKNAMDECAALYLQYTGENILSILHPSAEQLPGAEEILKNTRYSQPALFCIGYSLTLLWKSWGIHPSAFIGHSIGEFVAAHFAGIFSLEDALKLITQRGKLMSELPAGSMLSVRASADRIKNILPSNISLAAVNSPALCVVAGEKEAITSFQSVLENEKIVSRLLHTSHAFHSAMMEPVVAPFLKIVESIQLNQPVIPISSTVTGNWLTAQEATDPHYWANHLRNTVLFSHASQTLLNNGYKAFLELGPGNVTSTLVRQQAGQMQVIITPSLERDEDITSEYFATLKAAGTLWQNGFEIDWTSFYKNEQRIKLTNLPTYAFNKKSYWVNPPIADKVIAPYTNIVEAEHTTQHQPPLSNMRKELIKEKVLQLLEDTSGIDMDTITDDATFFEIGFDSLIMTQLAAAVKKEFNLPITFRQLSNDLATVEALTEHLDKNLAPDLFQPKQPATGQPNYTNNNQAHIPPPTANTAIDSLSQQLQQLAAQLALLQSSGQNNANAPAPKPSFEVNGNNKIATKAAIDYKDLSTEEITELKKPFGATAKIDKTQTTLNLKQEQFLQDLINRYVKKTKSSKDYTKQHRPYMADPRVVSGFKPSTKEIVYSIVVNKSKGTRLWDIDGNEYIDALNGFGANMLGHQPDFIVKALKDQIDAGFEVGPQHALAGEVAKLVCEFTQHERAALCNTGSEAVLGAMRIARTVTNKSIIVAFSGSYHGIVDEVVVRGTKKLKTFPAASGIMIGSVQNMLILEYGTPESLQIIKERADEIAGVLVEPVQSRRPDFLPIEFLRSLRTLTEAIDIPLIFDEVITGFRMHPRGMQGILGIKADLATYGKVIGGGISIGVIAGNKKYMDALDGGTWQYGDDSMPEVGVTYFAGTFVRHPLALATTKASLTYMKEKGITLQESLTKRTQQLVANLTEVCKQLNAPITIISYGSLWRIKFNKDQPYNDLLFVLLREKGIHILDGFPCYMTDAYTQNDISTIVKIFESSLNELIKAEFLTGVQALASTASSVSINYSESGAPVPGARLGRDSNGNPAWFIKDEKKPGSYLQVDLQ